MVGSSERQFTSRTFSRADLLDNIFLQIVRNEGWCVAPWWEEYFRVNCSVGCPEGAD